MFASGRLFACHAGLSIIDDTDTVNANAENFTSATVSLDATRSARDSAIGTAWLRLQDIAKWT